MNSSTINLSSALRELSPAAVSSARAKGVIDRLGAVETSTLPPASAMRVTCPASARPALWAAVSSCSFGVAG